MKLPEGLYGIDVDGLVNDYVVMKRPLNDLRNKYGHTAGELRKVLDAYPEKVAEAEALRSEILKKGYESMAPKALARLKKILMYEAEETFTDPKSGAVSTKLNGFLIRVQKDIAEGILEEVGAKKVKAKTLINTGTIGLVDRARELGGAKAIEARPVRDILASCTLDKDEKVIDLVLKNDGYAVAEGA